MIYSATFGFVSHSHEEAHLTVPIEVRRALELGIDGPVHLDISTAKGHVAGTFAMTSNGEVRASKRVEGENRALLGVVGTAEWGLATASRA